MLSYVLEIAESLRSEVPQDILPEGDTDLLFLMYAVLVLTVGQDVRPKHVHDTWSAWMTYQDSSHESIKPFDQLSIGTREEDQPFVNAIRRVSLRLSR